MKLRMGFVSNSSSSSFLARFDTVPQTEDELRLLMFGDEEYICWPSNEKPLIKYSTKLMAGFLLHEMDPIEEEYYDDYMDPEDWEVIQEKGGTPIYWRFEMYEEDYDHDGIEIPYDILANGILFKQLDMIYADTMEKGG